MNIEVQYDFWLKSANEDLNSAFDMLIIKRYNWALFVGHLALEKLLKSKYILKFSEQPPKTHNLSLLIEKLEIELDENQNLFLLTVNKFNIETRYADYKRDFEKICTKEFAEINLNKIKELFEWLIIK
jgi:HEPN domain-containing protein